jgi:hypothetical protein
MMRVLIASLEFIQGKTLLAEHGVLPAFAVGLAAGQGTYDRARVSSQ